MVAALHRMASAGTIFVFSEFTHGSEVTSPYTEGTIAMQADDGVQSPAVPLMPALDLRSAFRTLWGFLVHVVVGTSLFILLYVPAVGLHFVVGWLASLSVSYPLVFIVQLAEYSLVIADTALFVVFLGKTTLRTMRAV
jgi:hypothetical protein